MPPIYDTDKPYKYDTERAVSNEVIACFDFILDNMLTREEIICFRAAKIGLENKELAVLLECSERTILRNKKSGIKKLRKLAARINWERIRRDIFEQEVSEDLLKKTNSTNKSRREFRKNEEIIQTLF